MPVLIVSDPKTGKSQRVELSADKMGAILGLRIGGTVEGSIAGLPGQQLQFTGGTDKDGFPLRPDTQGGVKTQVLLSKGAGFHPKEKGERRKKTVRGNIVTAETTYLNFKILEQENGQN
jgi:small subunit ribosomal protein S6e